MSFCLRIFSGVINEKHPIRIDFDDDVVSTIRYFDENTQMTVNSIDEIMLKPIMEINTNKNFIIFMDLWI